ncbi:hypothetical protein [Pelovirga terrestris]|uniref:Circularly permuted type 2 ATP-grasp protein n=1 Tax=Pelovirga terrestris TaxID=2771352 RepID=A0A8J6QLK9_9BACT|nr:hypothetical protein [Pelovirga terrestris]MBD1400624.1 hypothetical protein [Pelovirga terrestris]
MMTEHTGIPISPTRVDISRHDLKRMHTLARTLFRLSQRTSYQQRVFPEIPEIARFDPGHAALMMGYDFHLGANGPKLIEVNTNAGGAFVAWQSQMRNLQGGDGIPLSERFQQRLLFSFQREWRDFSRSRQALQCLVLLDEDPPNQPLYPEMVSCRDWLISHGIDARIADPGDLQIDGDGVYHQERKVELIYNRHCDFFLEEDALAPLRAAYLAGSICLSPNPFAYGLLADKRRMILWSDEEVLQQLGLSAARTRLLLEMVPLSRLMGGMDATRLWDERKELIFKPVNKFGGRGVLMGKSITRKRFAELEPDSTLVQQIVPPSQVRSQDGEAFKVDLRLFVFRDHLLGVGARLYQGQLTNLRTPGGGFAPVRIV